VTEIKNLQFQPLTFHLANGRGLHLGPRERRELEDSDLSPEIALAARRGLVLLLPLPEPSAGTRVSSPPDSPPAVRATAASAIEESTTTTSDEAAGSGRRKRR